MRFKMRCHFTETYTPQDTELIHGVNAEIFEYLGDKAYLDDEVIGWLHEVFRMNVQLESQLVAGLPIVSMLIIDAIFGDRIRWQDVDWRYTCKAAMERNYKALEKFWTEAKMERFREFRPENTDMRFERLLEAECTVAERLQFLHRLRDWYTVRISHREPFSALRRRCEIIEKTRIYGYSVEFPNWIESPTPGELRQHREAAAAKRQKSKCGTHIDYINIPENKKSGKSRGSVFVNFEAAN